MWIRFKFRSALNFDVLDIGDRPSISVQELRSKIVTHKNLNLCHDFDLVFSDPLTGLEYNDDTYQIPSNSSVIIRRLPARPVPSARPFEAIADIDMKKSKIVREKSGEINDCNDFGIDLCPVPVDIFPYSDIESEKKITCDNDNANIAGSRSMCQKLQPSNLVEDFTKGSDHNDTEGKFPPEKREPKVQEQVKAGKKAVDPYDLAEKYASLPSELRCPICNKYFKEAVMIPCCQHSFCARCIRGFLSEKAKCPRCSSEKFRAEDLLPNLSLRQAIEHFIEFQIQFSVSESAMRRFASDEESGIYAKDFCNGATLVQKRPKNMTGGECDGYARHSSSEFGNENEAVLDDFQGENDPVILPQNHVQEKGEDIKASVTARYRKADRTCYMCDAPDHFIRDCPFANGPDPMAQPGNSMYPVGAMATYATPYWNNSAYGPTRPFRTNYANPGMMPYNASLYPVSPMGVSPYMSSMYGHIPARAPGGISRMASMGSLLGNRSGNPFSHAEVFDTQNLDIRENYMNDYMMRRQPCDYEDDDLRTGHYDSPVHSQEYMSYAERENSGSYLREKHSRRSRVNEHFDRDVVHDRQRKKYGSLTGTRNRRAYQDEKSIYGAINMSNGSDRYEDEQHNYHPKISRRHHGRSGHYSSGSSWGQRQGQKYKRRDYPDDKSFGKKHGGQFRSSLKPGSSGDQKRRYREVNHIRSSKHSRDGAKYIHNELFCRSKMVRRDEDYGRDYRQPKRKRVY